MSEGLSTRFIIVLVSLLLLFGTSAGKVVINEVELNPLDDDFNNEWVELYNTGDEPVDISGWKLLTTCGYRACVKIPIISPIPPKGFCVIFGCNQWLDNDEELVILTNAAGVEVDRTPYLDDTQNTDCCWSRYPDGYDSDTNFEWGFMESSKGKPASRKVCHPTGTRIYFHISGAIDGNVSPIEVTATGYEISPHSSYSANFIGYENWVCERTAALEGHYSAEEIIYNGERSIINAEPQVEKPEFSEHYFSLYGSKNIDYTGKEISDREYVGSRQYYSGADFLYSTNLSKERIGTSLNAYSNGITDLKYKQIREDGATFDEWLGRYVGEFNIERHIKTKFENDTYTSYYGHLYEEAPLAIYINGKLVDSSVVDSCVLTYSDVIEDIDDNWLTCCFADDELVGSKKSNVYHYSWCKYVDRINPENLIVFSSPSDAKSRGYRPCEVCDPPSKVIWSGPYAPCMLALDAGTTNVGTEYTTF